MAPVAAGGRNAGPVSGSFAELFDELFRTQFARIYRYLSRVSGEPDLAADLAQETFVKLHRRGAAPDDPEAWLITVSTNLLRNAKSTQARRKRLLTPARASETLATPPGSPLAEVEASETRQHVRSVLDRMPERERRLLVLLAGGYSYRDMALSLDLNEASIGTLLSRAKRVFADLYAGGQHAP